MGVVLETVLAGGTLANSPNFEDLTPGTGDVFTIRDYVPGSRAFIEEVWALDTTSVAELSLSSTRMNDGQEGLRLAIPSGAAIGPTEEPQVLLPGPVRLPVYRSDAIRVRAAGSNGDTVLAAYLVRYENLDGSDVRFITAAELQSRATKTYGIKVNPTNGRLDYGSPVALNSSDDRLEADRSYALLGATTDTPTGLITIQGPDTGRYKVGLPGKVDPVIGGDWFVRLSEKYGVASIPVIKANNKQSTLIATADAASGAAPVIDLILAQLDA